MSFPRKNAVAHSQLSAMGMSAEYVEALNTLSDSTMKKAYQQLKNDGTNSMEELCKILQQCKKASKVIQSVAPLPALPTGSSISAPPASRVVARGIVTKSLLPPPNRRMSGMPRLNGTKRMKVERQKSDSSFKLKDHQTKLKDQSSEKASSSSPPPSAMQFLAKLNKSTVPAKKPKAKETKKVVQEPAVPPQADEESEEEEELADDEELEDEEDEEEPELEDDDDPVRPRRQPSRRESPSKPAGTPPRRKQPGRSTKK